MAMRTAAGRAAALSMQPASGGGADVDGAWAPDAARRGRRRGWPATVLGQRSTHVLNLCKWGVLLC